MRNIVAHYPEYNILAGYVIKHGHMAVDGDVLPLHSLLNTSVLQDHLSQKALTALTNRHNPTFVGGRNRSKSVIPCTL